MKTPSAAPGIPLEIMIWIEDTCAARGLSFAQVCAARDAKACGTRSSLVIGLRSRDFPVGTIARLFGLSEHQVREITHGLFHRERAALAGESIEAVRREQIREARWRDVG